jgi:uncharacterized protein YllA (UPF0747 family)
MLTKDERRLLENVLDALDRLFDRESTVTDVYALLVATAVAVRGSSFSAPVEAPLRRLRDLVQSKTLPERRRDIGLELTDELRQFVAEQLRCDADENPRQRHDVSRGQG